MNGDELPYEGADAPLRYAADSPGFTRVVTLSDGVFAIALTLLVLTLDVPVAAADELGAALLRDFPQIVVVALSFMLVANLWWFHHKIVAQLAVFETGMIAINLVLLGLVALVPFPTNLVGNAPTARAAVLPLLAVFTLLSCAYLALLVRAHHVGAWRARLHPSLFRWVVIGWIGQLAGMGMATTVAVWVPVAGLVLAVATGTIVGVALAIVAPDGYRRWRGRPGL